MLLLKLLLLLLLLLPPPPPPPPPPHSTPPVKICDGGEYLVAALSAALVALRAARRTRGGLDARRAGESVLINNDRS